jgi:iron(III) transport system ATP-binding protein
MSDLEIAGLRKSFGATPVLRGLDLGIETGALAAVLGPSGCGKTTLLRLIAGFEAADAGSIRIGGRLVAGPGTHVPPERRRIGVVPQEGALFPHLDVAGNVGFGLARQARRGRRVGEVLELVGLSEYAHRMPHELSGGQQQRVALARALAPEPALVLLDEPFSALDTGLRAALRTEVAQVLRSAGATAVLVTHDQEEALSMADVVGVMEHGRLVQVAEPAEVYDNPTDLGVATFVGEATLVACVAHGLVAESALGAVPLRTPAHGVGHLVLRPEQVQVDTEPGGAGIEAIVVGSEFFGHDALVHCLVQDRSGRTLVSARRQGLHATLPADTTVYLRVGDPPAFFPGPHSP